MTELEIVGAETETETETAVANVVIEIGILKETDVEIGSATAAMVVTGIEDGSGSRTGIRIGIGSAGRETERGPVVTDQSL